MDNAVIHKSKIIRETIENSKNELLVLKSFSVN